ncbi:hypothetical protein CLOM_g3918 [Closterium sp. NIES-68]|nr:hypothetical protein CLOM_g3918 [Closterium sp. NIES-68]GJP66788.1 hypothetical protein CLOP_g23691 [Closterium sp. NIES-67]GJP81586.1 hypothetical protein CLOP_g11730 [Closterium sp. NIES-67]
MQSWSKELSDTMMAARLSCSDSPASTAFAPTFITALNHSAPVSAAATDAVAQPMSEWEEEFLQQLELSMVDSRGRLVESLMDSSVRPRSAASRSSKAGFIRPRSKSHDRASQQRRSSANQVPERPRRAVSQGSGLTRPRKLWQWLLNGPASPR